MQTRDLQSVLDEMFASEKEFSFEVVRDWQKRYPRFAKEIAEAVADWREFAFLALDETEEDLEQLSDSARRAMRKALAQPNADLRETAEKQGVAREDLKKLLGVSETFMRKIERRNIEVPEKFQEKIARVLRLSLESLEAFFAQPSALPRAARYKAKNAPKTQPKQSFAEAVRHDPEMTEEQKRELLKLE